MNTVLAALFFALFVVLTRLMLILDEAQRGDARPTREE